MKYQVGIIGTGNMGGALALAMGKAVQSVALCDKHPEKLAALCARMDNAVVTTEEDIAANAEFVVLAIKPNVVLGLAERIRGLIHPETIVVSVAAGVTKDEIAQATGTDRVIRIMPNTPVEVGEGLVLYCCTAGIGRAEEESFLAVMKEAGLMDPLEEKFFDAAAAVTGCGPAYAYMFAQALADGVLSCGVPRDKAARYAAQMMAGSAQMLLKSGKHPEKLKDDVCSPGGSTIAGVLALERGGFRAAVEQAVIAACEKNGKLK